MNVSIFQHVPKTSLNMEKTVGLSVLSIVQVMAPVIYLMVYVMLRVVKQATWGNIVIQVNSKFVYCLSDS